MLYSIFKIMGLIAAGMAAAIFLNYYIIEPIIIGDPCDYHAIETNKVFDVFYKIDSDDGYHPTPTRFNEILTMILGTTPTLFILFHKKQRG